MIANIVHLVLLLQLLSVDQLLPQQIQIVLNLLQSLSQVRLQFDLMLDSRLCHYYIEFVRSRQLILHAA